MDYVNNAQRPEVTEADKALATELAKIIAPVPVVGQQRIRDCAWGIAKGIESGYADGFKAGAAWAMQNTQGQQEQPA